MSPSNFPQEEDVIRLAYSQQPVPVFGGRTLDLIVLEEMAENVDVSLGVLVAKAQREIDLPPATLEAEIEKTRRAVLRPLVQPVWFHLAVAEVTSRDPPLNPTQVVEAVKKLIPNPFNDEYIKNPNLLRYHIFVWIKLCLIRLKRGEDNACLKVDRRMPDGSVASKYIISRKVINSFLGELVWQERVRIASLSLQ